MLEALVSWKAVFLYGYVLAALAMHYRGRDRHRFHRQFTDHSTVVAPYNFMMYGFSAVDSRPYADVSRFPELAPLRDNWQMIRDEALQLCGGGHVKASDRHNDIGFNSFFRRGWKRFYLKWYDAPQPSARALCPRTVALVESIPIINGAMFALLPAGGDLGRHRDPFAGSLRYHLGLSTPNDDACRIVVDGQSYSWRDGQDVIFDETYLHWAENKSDKDRLILFCDIERPLTNRYLAAVNRWIERTFVRASQAENVPGDKVGFLNRIFGTLYYVRLPAKALKQRNKYAYYTVKWLVLAAILYWIFFTSLT